MKIVKKILSVVMSLCMLGSNLCLNISAAGAEIEYEIREMLENGMSEIEILEKLSDESCSKGLHCCITYKPGTEISSLNENDYIEIGEKENTYIVSADPKSILGYTKLEGFQSIEFVLLKTPEEAKADSISDMMEALKKYRDDETELFIALADGEKIEDYLLPDTEYRKSPLNCYYLKASKDTMYKYIDMYRADDGSKIEVMDICFKAYIEDELIMCILTGDINSDGKIDVTDLSELSLALADGKEFTGEKLEAADVDGDGKSTLSDLARMRQYLSKIITSFG